MTRLSNYVTELGWDNYAVDHEDGNGQFEINVTFADALETADRAIFFRYMVDSLAEEYGMIATFMPKPFTDNTGNGFHYTMSLWDTDRRKPLRRERPTWSRPPNLVTSSRRAFWITPAATWPWLPQRLTHINVSKQEPNSSVHGFLWLSRMVATTEPRCCV